MNSHTALGRSRCSVVAFSFEQPALLPGTSRVAVHRTLCGWKVTKDGCEVPGRGPYPDEKALAESLGMVGLPEVWPAGADCIYQDVETVGAA